ncbi:glycohydrolase toxin TNT-related protein [Candidatus Mycolicibacterium alkanivorans]|uniref:Glycohydrolase toxin TNT-related protein n=1 Tax=Candidatus Mycolicibacterium alkanivorans TaxID=2954114 RepID=A0ABS9Z1G2_9MYCO|nr:glycohydrolase toxin TNT-related protein [Candidatus Mycolicibacterium alkanivorans]MCI4676803.1 glycohydrolase toxin TNT-related protein [Candidatus Mycolicibacterium alkanivorans]
MAAARNGLVNLGEGVRVSAHNYSLGEAQSDVSGRAHPLPVPAASGPISASPPPSAVGAGDAAPAGFGWVAKYIGMIWPNGDSGRLRAAGAAWTAAGTQLVVTETAAGAPLGIIGGQQIPEAEAMGQAFAASIDGAVQIMNQCTTMAAQLTAYAAKIDAVKGAIIDLLSRICDPMTGFKQVWDVLTGEDEDEIKQIANDIETVVDNFKAETAALALEMSAAMAAAETVATAMGEYAAKEWNQFLHGTDVGQVVDQDLRFVNGVVGQAGDLLKDNWKYGPFRAMTQPDRWFEDWENTVTGMAPLVGLGGGGAPGVGESWKQVGKEVSHWDLWSKDPAEAAGRTAFDVGTLFAPGGGVGAAGKATHGAAEAAEAAGRAAPHVADASPQVLKEVAKGAESTLPPPVHVPAPAGGAPRPLPDGPAKPASPDAARPKPAAPPPAEPRSAPVTSAGPHGPTERAPSAAGTAEHEAPVEGPKPTGEPGAPTLEPAPSRAGSEAPSSASLPESAPSQASGARGAAGHSPDAPSGGHTPSPYSDAQSAGHPAATPHDGGAGNGGGPLHGDNDRSHPTHGDSSSHETGEKPTDPVHSHEPAGQGWERQDNYDPVDPTYGEPLEQHWEFVDNPVDPERINPQVAELIADPSAPFGRAPDGHAFTAAEYAERFNKFGPDGQHWSRFPNNAGAVQHSIVEFDDLPAFQSHFGLKLDRIGDDNGKFLAVMLDGHPATWEERALHVDSLQKGYYSYTIENLPPGWKIEASEAARGLGQPGGSIQIRFVDESNEVVTIDQLTEELGVLNEK